MSDFGHESGRDIEECVAGIANDVAIPAAFTSNFALALEYGGTAVRAGRIVFNGGANGDAELGSIRYARYVYGKPPQGSI